MNIIRGLGIIVLFSMTTIVLLDAYWVWLSVALILLAVLPIWNIFKLLKEKEYFTQPYTRAD